MQESKPRDAIKKVPTIDMAKQLDPVKVSFVKEAAEKEIALKQERATKKTANEWKAFLLQREHARLLNYHGQS